MKDRNVKVDIGDKEKQHAPTNAGTIPKATIRSIDIISKPRDSEKQRRSTPRLNNKKTDILNSRENFNQNEKGIPGDESRTIQVTYFPFGMIQTPLQIMLNWLVKFGNYIVDSLTYFLNNFLKFKRL